MLFLQKIKRINDILLFFPLFSVSQPAAITIQDLQRAMFGAGSTAAATPAAASMFPQASPSVAAILSAEEIINTGVLNDVNGPS